MALQWAHLSAVGPPALSPEALIKRHKQRVGGFDDTALRLLSRLFGDLTQSLLLCERVGDVPEVDARDQLLWALHGHTGRNRDRIPNTDRRPGLAVTHHVHQQLPQRLQGEEDSESRRNGI